MRDLLPYSIVIVNISGIVMLLTLWIPKFIEGIEHALEGQSRFSIVFIDIVSFAAVKVSSLHIRHLHRPSIHSPITNNYVDNER
jgi:hypothetical protein